MMESLTSDMKMLCDEITTLRNARVSLMKDLAQGARDFHQEVSAMQDGFRQSNMEMGLETKAERVAFTSGLKGMVLGMRKEFAADLTGARRAWLTLSAKKNRT